MIWKLAEPNIYLLGAVHFLEDGTNTHSKQVDKIYSESTHIVLEANTDQMNPKIFHYLDGQKLAENTPSELFNQTKTAWLQHNLPLHSLETMKPWGAALALLEHLFAKQGFFPQNGTDSQIFIRAKRDGKTISFLEPPNAGLDVFDAAPKQEQIEFLSSVVNDPQDQIDTLKKIINAWTSSDTKTLESIHDDALRKFPVLMTDIIINRNRAWEPALKNIINRRHSTLITVGALHCVGNERLGSPYFL